MQTTPSSLHILDVSPHDQFTVSCSARAELEGETVPLAIFIDWRVRKDKPSSHSSFFAVSSTRYRTTGSPEDGYLSILNITGTDIVNTISYCCRANLVVGTNIIQRKYSDTAVKGVSML